MHIEVTPERSRELRVGLMQSELDYSQSLEAERQLADCIITEVVDTLSASDTPKTSFRPIYSRYDPRTQASVRVEALGSKSTTLPIHESSTLWGIHFTSETGEPSSAIMFGRKLLSWDSEKGEFSSGSKQASNMLSLWKSIQESSSESFLIFNGFNVVNRAQTDRIRKTGRILGLVVRHRWQQWMNDNL